MLRRIVYGAMTTFEEDKLRSIEEHVVDCLDEAGRERRHFWDVKVQEGVRYVTFGSHGEILAISSERVLTMPAEDLVAIVKKTL